MIGDLALFATAAVAAIYVAAAMGAHTAANALAIPMSTATLGLRHALLIGVIGALAGAWLVGGVTTATLHNQLIMPSAPAAEGFTAALLATAVWLTVALRIGWPVSITHCVIAGLIGYAIAGPGAAAVNWTLLGLITIGWTASPLIAAVLAFVITSAFQQLVFHAYDPERRAPVVVAATVALTVFCMVLATCLGGLQFMAEPPSPMQSLLYATIAGSGVALIGWRIGYALRPASDTEVREFHYANVERQFGVALTVAAAGLAYAHGANDVANVLGPLLAIGRLTAADWLAPSAGTGAFVLLAGGAVIAIGLAALGFRVLRQVGTDISHLTPSRGCALTLGTALTVLLASIAGMPVSTGHTLVGAILGVALARGLSAIDLRAVRGVFLSWVVTLPTVALLTTAIFAALRAMV